MKNPFKRKQLDLNIGNPPPINAEPVEEPAPLVVYIDHEVFINGPIGVPDERGARILRNRLDEWMEALTDLADMYVKLAIDEAKEAYEAGAQR